MRNVRNFWIDAHIDGRSTKLSGGPRAKDGEISLYIRQRHNGCVTKPLSIEGWEREGELFLNIVTDPSVGDWELVIDDDGTHRLRCRTKR